MADAVAIILLNHNQAEYTRDCLASLEGLDYPNCRVLVVDNGSSDQALRHVAHEFPTADFLWLPLNVGVAAGRNAGVRQAWKQQPEYVLFLDNDTLVAPDFLSRLVARIKSDPNIAAVQAKICFAEPPYRICSVGGKLYPRISHYRHPGSGQRDVARFQRAADIDIISGCAALIRAKALEKTGLLDETYSPYCHEDVDFSLRLRDAGYRLLVEPAAVVWHRVSCCAQTSPAKLRYQAKGHVLFLRFHTRRRDLPLSLAWISLHMLRRYVLPALLRADCECVGEVLRGIREGLRQERRSIPMPAGERPLQAGREPVLLLGVLGPSDSGPTRVYEALLHSEFTQHFRVRFLDVRISRDLPDFERLRAGKLLRLLWHLLRTAFWLIRDSYRAVCVPLATNAVAFVKDALFIWLAALFGIPTIVLEHGTNIPCLYERSGSVLRAFMRATLRRASRCIVLADRLRVNFEGLVPPERIVSVHLGIPESPEEELGPRPADRHLTILYLSALLPGKGLMVLLEAIPALLQARNDLRFVIAGGWGGDAQEFQARVAEFIGANHLEPVVNFLGPVEGEHKLALLREADLFAFPSLVDSYGIVLLEAMRAGLPIVASEVGAIPEIVADGVNGLICRKGSAQDLTEKILFLAERPQLRRQMRENNLQRFANFFTSEKFAARMIAVFQAVFAESQPESKRAQTIGTRAAGPEVLP